MASLPFQIQEYDPDQYVMLFAGVAISQGAGQSGYADGEWFSSKVMAPSFTDVVGVGGVVVRTKVNDHRVDMFLNLLQTCELNAYLSGLVAADEGAPNGAGIGSFALYDLAGTTQIVCPNTWIVQPADLTLDKTAKDRKWNIRGVRSVYIIGGN
jgi:hypothetical protein